MKKKASLLTQSLRTFRKYHKYIGVMLALFLLISALTGLLLAWKKHSPVIQPFTQDGSTEVLNDWLPLALLAETAREALYEAHSEQSGNLIDRMDVRPDKGVVKVLFADGWWEVQVDGKTGAVLSVARRHSDWIEALHDGSIISDGFKLLSMNALGLGLMVMVLTGVWLWYGPKQLRELRRGRK